MAERFVQAHLRRLPLFEQLSPPQIGVVSGVVHVLRFEPGQLVFQEGQPTQGMVVFVSGRGILTRRAPNGVDESVGAVEAGQYVDEVALYTEGIEEASLRVVEPAVALIIPRTPFVQLLAAYPEIRANLRVQTQPGIETRDTPVKLFKGLRPDETVLKVWRRHWWAVARHSWVAVVVLIALFGVALLIAERAPILALGAAGLAVVIPGIIIAYLYYDWQDDSIVLSDQRIVRIWHHLLSFETTISEIPLDRVLEINISIPPADPFARIFGYGYVTVRSAGEGNSMVLDIMPKPLSVQAMIFAQRDRFREKIEQRQRDEVRSDVALALGISQQQEPLGSVPGTRRSDREAVVGLPFIRTKFLAANGDLVYRKHSSIWLAHVFLPSLMILAALVLLTISVFAPTPPLGGGLGLGLGMFVLIIGVIWLYIADWDWRNDLFIIGAETITLIRQRPLWLQNEVERIRISQIDNVKSEMRGLINSLLNRGNVRISLIGSDIKDAKVMDMIYDPQEIQAEISRRHAAIKTERQQSDLDQQRQVVKEYLQSYHEIQKTQQMTEAAPPPMPTQPAPYSAPTMRQEPPPESPPPARDGIRPPRVPRRRPE
ncbi:MAG: cyclic nucleotide-binding domain-containing protein [Anaerolineae bacterium]|nr:cyclic nucleotide-binding domain-containing protein [Anaerolineae bacterium]